MSMKEYELLRKKYSQNNETNYHNSDYKNNNYNYNYNNINQNKEKEKWKRSETYDKNNYNQIKDINQEIQDTNKQVINNLYFNSNNNHMHNIGLKHYDWGSDEKTTMPEINNFNYNRNMNKNNINIDNNGNKVLNENLFKRNTKKMHSIYGANYSNKNSFYNNNKDKVRKDINYFNNQIMQNKNWGNVNNLYKEPRNHFSNSIRKVEGMNMRTRKKI